MTLIPKDWGDDELEAANDGSAAYATSNEFWQINPSSFNALVCEVQAWRRKFPHLGFMSGPNELEIVDHPPAERTDL